MESVAGIFIGVNNRLDNCLSGGGSHQPFVDITPFSDVVFKAGDRGETGLDSIGDTNCVGGSMG